MQFLSFWLVPFRCGFLGRQNRYGNWVPAVALEFPCVLESLKCISSHRCQVITWYGMKLVSTGENTHAFYFSFLWAIGVLQFTTPNREFHLFIWSLIHLLPQMCVVSVIVHVCLHVGVDTCAWGDLIVRGWYWYLPWFLSTLHIEAGSF